MEDKQSPLTSAVQSEEEVVDPANPFECDDDDVDEVDHVDMSSWYESRQTLHRIRVTLFFFITCMWSVGLIDSGWSWFPHKYKFFTIWSETMVMFYLMWAILYFPKGRVFNGWTVVMQEAILTCQTFVVLIYWSVLVPFGSAGGNNFQAIFEHSVPFLTMVHEMLFTYGQYSFKSELVGAAIFTIYICFNILLYYTTGIIVYKTPLTDPSKWFMYLFIPVLTMTALGVGRLYTLLKKKVSWRLHLSRTRRLEAKHDRASNVRE